MPRTLIYHIIFSLSHLTLNSTVLLTGSCVPQRSYLCPAAGIRVCQLPVGRDLWDGHHRYPHSNHHHPQHPHGTSAVPHMQTEGASVCWDSHEDWVNCDHSGCLHGICIVKVTIQKSNPSHYLMFINSNHYCPVKWFYLHWQWMQLR